MTSEQQKMVDSKLYTRQPTGEPPVRSSDMVRLSLSEYIVTAYAQPADGPGWSNTPLWVVISDRANGKMREHCIPPSEQTQEMISLYAFAALTHASMKAAVERVVQHTQH